MGNQCTSLQNIEANEFLKRLCGSESIAPSDPFWNQLFSFAFTVTDSVAQDHAIDAFCTTLCTNNTLSGNLACLIRAIILRAEQLKSDSQWENPILCWQLANALGIMRVIVRHFVETLTDEKIVEQFNASPANQRRVAEAPSSLTTSDRRYQQAGRARPQPANGAPVNDLNDPAIPYEGTFLSTVIELLIDIPLNSLTYFVHIECLQVLLTAVASQAYRSEPVRIDTSIFYHHLVHGKCALHACMLMKALFANFAARYQPPRRSLLQIVTDHGLLASAMTAETEAEAKKSRKLQLRKDELRLQPAPEAVRKRPEANTTTSAGNNPDGSALYNATAYVASTVMYMLTLGRWSGSAGPNGAEKQPGNVTSAATSGAMQLNQNAAALNQSASGQSNSAPANITRTPVSAGQMIRFESLTSGSPHATYSVLLILVLGNHCVQSRRLQPILPIAGSAREGSHSQTHNPYREALLVFTNSSEPISSVPSPATQSVAIFTVDYARLYRALAATCAEEHCTLLLYLLVHRNINLRAFLLSRTDLESLIVPLLHVLYEPAERNSQHVYMALIVLLIISEDDDFSKAVHEIKLGGVQWFKERVLSEITLGSLMILVVIRVIHFNLKRLKDRYLHTNCLATLANMSGRFRNLHPYVAQRILGLINQLLKRRDKISALLSAGTADAKANSASPSPASTPVAQPAVAQLSPSELAKQGPKIPSNPQTAASDTVTRHESASSVATISNAGMMNVTTLQQPGNPLSSDEVRAYENEVELLDELLRMWLEIVNSCLLNGLQANANLLYALLYERDLVTHLKRHSQFSDLVHNLDLVLTFLIKRLETVQNELGVNDLSVEIVTNAIRDGIRLFRRDRLKKSPDLKFKYIEEDSPEDFFVPYIWSLIYRLRFCAFSPNRIKLFEVAVSPPPTAATKQPITLTIDTSTIGELPSSPMSNGSTMQSPVAAPASPTTPTSPRQKGVPLVV